MFVDGLNFCLPLSRVETEAVVLMEISSAKVQCITLQY
jgi:hypothetical protein